LAKGLGFETEHYDFSVDFFLAPFFLLAREMPTHKGKPFDAGR
jgi:hypothetical protein